MSYLGFTGTSSGPITGITPLSYRDGLTLLQKLESLWEQLIQYDTAIGAIVAKEAKDFADITSQYLKLVDDWNKALARLDPTAVSALVSGFETKWSGELNNLKAADTALGVRIDGVTTAIDSKIGVAKGEIKTAYEAADKVVSDLVATNKAGVDAALATLRVDAVLETEFMDRMNTVGPTLLTPTGDSPLKTSVLALIAAQTKTSSGGMFYLSAYCDAEQKAGTKSASTAVDKLFAAMDAYNAAGPTLPDGANTTIGHSGGMMVIDGKFLIDKPIPLRNGLTVLGYGTRASRLHLTTGDMFQVKDGEHFSSIHMTNFGVSIGSGAGSFFRGMSSTSSVTTALVKSRFEHLMIDTYSDTSDVINIGGYCQMHSTHFRAVEIDRPNTSKAHAFYVNTSNGNYCNSNSFTDSWIHGHNCVGKPAFHIQAAQGFQHNWEFRNICGEQNAGGLIHAYGIDYLKIENCIDWDATVSYTKPVIQVGTSSGGYDSCNVFVTASGRPEPAKPNLTVPVDVLVANGTRNSYIMGCNQRGNQGNVVAGNYTRVDNLKEAFVVASGSYTMLPTDENVLVTAGGTITLPDPVSCQPFTTVGIYNVSGATITLVTANSKPIAGNVTTTLASGQAMKFVTDGVFKSSTGYWWKWAG